VGLAVLLAGTVVMTGAAPAPADPQTDKSRVDRQLVEAQATYESASAQAQAALAAYNETSQRLTVAQENLAVVTGVVAARRVAATQAGRDVDSARAAQDAADQRFVEAGASSELSARIPLPL
jgi:hypothetical protein